MISLKQSYEIEYNGIENCARMDLFADSAGDLTGLTHYDNIKLLEGSDALDISTGDHWIKQSGGIWIRQPSGNMFENVYTKSDIDSMITEIYQYMMYYHTVQTSTDGTITFYAFEGDVGNLTIYGNGEQGDPPTFCGDRTENLFEGTILAVETNAGIKNGLNFYGVGTYTLSADGVAIEGDYCYVQIYHNGNYSASMYITVNSRKYEQTFTLSDGDRAVIFSANNNEALSTSIGKFNRWKIMLNAGTESLPYEPFGYKIPISCNGQTPIYMDAPLRKALDGSDAVDILSNAGTIIREVDADGNALDNPTTQTITFPTIPTVNGQNMLTVDTELLPSKIEISGE